MLTDSSFNIVITAIKKNSLSKKILSKGDTLPVLLGWQHGHRWIFFSHRTYSKQRAITLWTKPNWNHLQIPFPAPQIWKIVLRSLIKYMKMSYYRHKKLFPCRNLVWFMKLQPLQMNLHVSIYLPTKFHPIPPSQSRVLFRQFWGESQRNRLRSAEKLERVPLRWITFWSLGFIPIPRWI